MASTSRVCRNVGGSPVWIAVRHMRRKAPNQGKPPILPPSKTVRYHVVHVPWQKPEHVEELLWRRHVYNNVMVSLRQVFKEEIRQKEEQGLGIEALREKEIVELDQLISENEERNRKAAVEREERDKVRHAESKNIVLDELEKTFNAEFEDVEKRTKEVQDMIERSVHFVTKDNLEQKIAEALENPKVYDYAINLKGQRFYDPVPVKYQTGTPTRQKGRLYDRTLAWTKDHESTEVNEAQA